MAQITAEQLLGRVTQQAGRIATLELMNEALTAENTQLTSALEALQNTLEAKEVKDVANDVAAAAKNGKPKP